MFATEEYFVKKIANLEATVQRVRELHKAGRCDCGAENCDSESICQHCWQVHPCETIEALDGIA